MKLPLSGSEKKFTHRLWSSRRGVGNNNCYAYAFSDYEAASRPHKSIPGDRSGLSSLPHSYTHCKDLARRVLSDNPRKVYTCKDPQKRCKKGYYKTMLFVAPARPSNFIKQGDFHWYKQHGVVEYKVKKGDTITSVARFFKVPLQRVSRAVEKARAKNKVLRTLKPGKLLTFKANVWSHKRGWATGALLTDAKGKIIKDPRTASRAYPGLNYKLFCNAFCVAGKGVRVGPTAPAQKRRNVGVKSKNVRVNVVKRKTNVRK